MKGWKQRHNIAKEQAIFLTTSGMLTGGPVLDYVKEHFHDPNSAILMTGYQAEHTNGRLLLQEGKIFIDGWKTHVKCFVENHDFSAHAGRTDLRNLVKKTNPRYLVVQHGEPDSVQEMADWAEALGFKVFAPNVGDSINIPK